MNDNPSKQCLDIKSYQQNNGGLHSKLTQYTADRANIRLLLMQNPNSVRYQWNNLRHFQYNTTVEICICAHIPISF